MKNKYTVTINLDITYNVTARDPVQAVDRATKTHASIGRYIERYRNGTMNTHEYEVVDLIEEGKKKNPSNARAAKLTPERRVDEIAKKANAARWKRSVI